MFISEARTRGLSTYAFHPQAESLPCVDHVPCLATTQHQNIRWFFSPPVCNSLSQRGTCTDMLPDSVSGFGTHSHWMHDFDSKIKHATTFQCIEQRSVQKLKSTKSKEKWWKATRTIRIHVDSRCSYSPLALRRWVALVMLKVILMVAGFRVAVGKKTQTLNEGGKLFSH